MLKAEQAFELADASAERSAAACVLRLAEENVVEYLRSNAALLRWMIQQGDESAAPLNAVSMKSMRGWQIHRCWWPITMRNMRQSSTLI